MKKLDLFAVAIVLFFVVIFTVGFLSINDFHVFNRQKITIEHNVYVLKTYYHGIKYIDVGSYKAIESLKCVRWQQAKTEYNELKALRKKKCN
jgi:hypothetical protein